MRTSREGNKMEIISLSLGSEDFAKLVSGKIAAIIQQNGERSRLIEVMLDDIGFAEMGRLINAALMAKGTTFAAIELLGNGVETLSKSALDITRFLQHDAYCCPRASDPEATCRCGLDNLCETLSQLLERIRAFRR